MTSNLFVFFSICLACVLPSECTNSSLSLDKDEIIEANIGDEISISKLSKRAASKLQVYQAQHCTCGISSPRSRIINGEPALQYEYPWIGTVIRMAKPGSSSFTRFCAATLIADRVAISAAHCFKRDKSTDDLYVVFSIRNIYDTNDDNTHKVSRLEVHKSFDPETVKNDIAILIFDLPVHIGRDLSPICLPSAKNTYVDKPAAIAGFGSTEYGGSSSSRLLKAEVQTMSNSGCIRKFGFSGRRLVGDNQMCAYDDESDTCQGDSGGPLMVKSSKGYYTQAGVVSFGIGCSKGYPGVYTRITSYLRWIFEKSGKAIFCRGFLQQE